MLTINFDFFILLLIKARVIMYCYINLLMYTALHHTRSTDITNLKMRFVSHKFHHDVTRRLKFCQKFCMSTSYNLDSYKSTLHSSKDSYKSYCRWHSVWTTFVIARRPDFNGTAHCCCKFIIGKSTVLLYTLAIEALALGSCLKSKWITEQDTISQWLFFNKCNYKDYDT